ncbi:MULTISPECIES: hypothetical protein [Methylomicrobium]|uniref:Uncharacterized protein n=1 Tax=Methylomicrobium album BG8 TaxID=686340 RepID=H8GLP5_METAL|nr:MULTISPECIES: hypothetical protein [Methylomicrobium]EIC30572.1 hypothetical protein Metal_2886 [Methylomicrobium album BG8]
MTQEQREAILKDAEVAEALYKLATEGFNFTETKELKDENGNVFQVETLTRHVPPSVEAQIFWLCNRCPDQWKVDESLLAFLFGQVQEQVDDFLWRKPH